MHSKNCCVVMVLVLACSVLAGGVARAGTITYAGLLNDAGNSALVGSDLGPALFGDEWEIANNVALYEIAVPIAGNVRFRSLGFGAGGADPYFTLFAGAGTGATVLDSNYVQAFSTGGDFDLTRYLPVGTYTFALGDFANMSLAENYGSGSLGDGFTGLGVPFYLGTSYYEVAVTQPDEAGVVPEPATMLLLASGLAGVSVVRRRLQKSSGR